MSNEIDQFETCFDNLRIDISCARIEAIKKIVETIWQTFEEEGYKFDEMLQVVAHLAYIRQDKNKDQDWNKCIRSIEQASLAAHEAENNRQSVTP